MTKEMRFFIKLETDHLIWQIKYSSPEESDKARIALKLHIEDLLNKITTTRPFKHTYGLGIKDETHE